MVMGVTLLESAEPALTPASGRAAAAIT
jgi:hypothetical protein